jgi:Molecular chaperone (small heat shock protein)
MRTFTLLKTRKAETLLDEIEQMQRRITERAYEMFRARGAALGAALNDWLSAERQAVWTPPVEVCQKNNQFVVEAALAGVEPRQLDIQVTRDTLLIKADTQHTHPEAKGIVHVCEFQPGQLFRAVAFPARINPDAVRAEYRDGLLRVTAAIAGEQGAEGRRPSGEKT